jgi:hypothetical protein
MPKKLKYFIALSLVLFSAFAVAQCGYIMQTNVQGVVWQNCGSQVAIGNNGPAFVTLDFSVYYAEGGIPGHWRFTIAPGSYITVPSPGTAVNVVVNAAY